MSRIFFDFLLAVLAMCCLTAKSDQLQVHPASQLQEYLFREDEVKNQSGSPQTKDISLSISGIDDRRGSLIISIFLDSESYLEMPFMTEIFPLKPTKNNILILEKMPFTKVSISVIHDENNNSELDTTWMGIPLEAVGFSNNAKGFMGPPSFEDTLVDLGLIDELEITLIKVGL